MPVTPSVRRAIEESRKRLEEMGHELVPFSPPRVDEMMNSFINMLSADQNKSLLEAMYNFYKHYRHFLDFMSFCILNSVRQTTLIRNCN